MLWVLTGEELAAEAGIELTRSQELVLVHKGEILSQFMSLQFQGVKNGSRIIYYIKDYPNEFPFGDSPRQCSETLSQFIDCPGREDNETRRLADLGFTNWEPCRDFAAVMMEMIQIQEEEDETAESVLQYPTVLAASSAIPESPLPVAFGWWFIHPQPL
jgi:hypothetical protein